MLKAIRRLTRDEKTSSAVTLFKLIRLVVSKDRAAASVDNPRVNAMIAFCGTSSFLYLYGFLETIFR